MTNGTKGSTIKREQWFNINIMFFHIPSWWVLILPQCFGIFQVNITYWIINELHYITLTHLNLLEYNYIVVPPPSEFCECIFSCGRCARTPHICWITFHIIWTKFGYHVINLEIFISKNEFFQQRCDKYVVN
jgi:hypothetical protein